VGGEKRAMSLKFVTMRVGVDGLYSRALETAYSTREEIFPVESNKSSGYIERCVRMQPNSKGSLTRDRTIGAVRLNSSAMKVAP